MSAETKFVFLDVQPFKAQDLDFFSDNLKRLIRLATEGELQLILTYVTEQETRDHINKHAKHAFRQARDYQKVDRIVKKLLTPEGFKALSSADEENLRSGMQSEFSRFLQVSGAQILPIDDVSPRAVFEKYFPDRPGFWGGAVFAGFHEAPRFRCRSRNSLWPSKLSASIFRQPTSVQQSLLPFPRP